jgi:hypothetical protein
VGRAHLIAAAADEHFVEAEGSENQRRIARRTRRSKGGERRARPRGEPVRRAPVAVLHSRCYVHVKILYIPPFRLAPKFHLLKEVRHGRTAVSGAGRPG